MMEQIQRMQVEIQEALRLIIVTLVLVHHVEAGNFISKRLYFLLLQQLLFILHRGNVPKDNKI